jgi:hypothetical protein
MPEQYRILNDVLGAFCFSFWEEDSQKKQDEQDKVSLFLCYARGNLIFIKYFIRFLFLKKQNLNKISNKTDICNLIVNA